MKKRIVITTVLLLIACLVVGLVACDKDGLKAPSGLEMSGNVLTWQAVDGAEGYEVVINDGQPVKTKDTMYFVEVAETGTYNIRVRAYKGEKYSEYSEAYRYVVSEMLDKPSVTYDELTKVVSWNAVEGAAAYSVRVRYTDKDISAEGAVIELSEVSTTTYTLTKEEVFAEIEQPGKKVAFNYLKNLGIIKKNKGRYFYSEENETNTKVRQSNGKVIAIIIAIIVVILVASAIYSNLYKDQNLTVWNDDVSFALENGWTELDNSSNETEWTYYKYISEIPVATTNTEGQNQIDYTQYPATLVFSYEQESSGTYNTMQELRTSLETYITEQVLPTEYSIEEFTTENGYEALKIYLKYTDYPEEIDYIYYVRNQDGRLAYFTAITFNMEDQEQLDKEATNMVNTFKWEN